MRPPPKNTKKAAKYYAQNPQPPYSAFGEPDYIDMKGREYKVACGSFAEKYQEQEGAFAPDFDAPSLDTEGGAQTWGAQMLWFRVPIALRGTVPPPSLNELENQVFALYHVRRQVLCTARVEAVYTQGRHKTGHILIADAVTTGQVADPANYEHLLRRELKKWIPPRGR